MTRVYKFALATVLATFVLTVIGGVARLHPAGTGCGNDWPRCNGSWLPALAWEPLVEYLHRLAALSVLALALATAVTAFCTPGVASRVRILAAASASAVIVQAAIGGLAALWGAPAGIAILHLATAMLFLACAAGALATAAAELGAPAWLATLGRAPAPDADRVFASIATAGAAVAFLLVMIGAATSATGTFACPTWPLCGSSGPEAEVTAVVHLGYRATALLGTLVAATAFIGWRRRADAAALRLGLIAAGLVVVQTTLNGVATMSGDPAWISAPHLLVAALFWLIMLGLAAVAWGPRPAASRHVAATADGAAVDYSAARPGNAEQRAAIPDATGTLALATTSPGLAIAPLRPLFAQAYQVIADYVALTKPGIMTLLLTTTLCAMLMAARGLPPFWLVAVTLLGGVLASGGANVLNCFLDRDIDAQMTRTRNRAIAAGRVSSTAALAYGVTLTVAAVLLLGLLVNWTAAALALGGNLFYVFIYTKWLKRTTPYNIVIGGAAGAVPPLVGWAAVTGNLSPLAWGLFAIVFAWTPPHFWALALLKQGEYTRAAVPMLPVVRGEAETRRQIVIYTALLMLVCLSLAPLGLGAIYLASALILNGIFLCYAVRLYREPSKRIARQMFFYSLWYLAFLFAAAVIDRMVIV